MAIVDSVDISEPATAAGPRLLTAADLAVLPEQLPSGPVRYELHQGRLIIMNPPGVDHGELQLTIGCELRIRSKGEGLSTTETTVIAATDPDDVLVPDVQYVRASRLPIKRSPEGYLETIPDLVVEVRSKNDSRPELEKKAAAYLKAGVAVVWVVDPFKKCVVVYRPNVDAQTLAKGQALTLEDAIIPGFSLPIDVIFPG
jgi:Uma2 family endonuclease